MTLFPTLFLFGRIIQRPIVNGKHHLDHGCNVKQHHDPGVLAQHPAAHDEHIGDAGYDCVDAVPLAAVVGRGVVHGDRLPDPQVADGYAAHDQEGQADHNLPECHGHELRLQVLQEEEEEEQQAGGDADHVDGLALADAADEQRHEQRGHDGAQVDCHEVDDLRGGGAQVHVLLEEDRLLLDRQRLQRVQQLVRQHELEHLVEEVGARVAVQLAVDLYLLLDRAVVFDIDPQEEYLAQSLQCISETHYLT